MAGRSGKKTGRQDTERPTNVASKPAQASSPALVEPSLRPSDRQLLYDRFSATKTAYPAIVGSIWGIHELSNRLIDQATAFSEYLRPAITCYSFISRHIL